MLRDYWLPIRFRFLWIVKCDTATADSTADAWYANRSHARMHAPSPELMAPQTEHPRSADQSASWSL